MESLIKPSQLYCKGHGGEGGSGDLSFICTMYRLKRHGYQYSFGLYSFPLPSGLLSCHLRLSNSTTMSLKSYRSYLYLSVEGSG